MIRCNRDFIQSWETFNVADASPFDCYGEFGAWGDCSKSCGHAGKKIREYSILVPEVRGGQKCPHPEGFAESAPCNPQACGPRLTRSLWLDVHGKAAVWRNDNGHLKHFQPGATDMSADGTYKLKPTTLAAEPSFQCKLDKSFDSPVDSIEDGGEMVSGFFTPPDSGMYGRRRRRHSVFR